MINIVLLGGNGYIGQNVIKEWQQADKEANFYVVSRSGKGALTGRQIHYIQTDIKDLDQIKAQLPEKVDYIINFIGFAFADKKGQVTLRDMNMQPARLPIQLAKDYQVKAQGFIGGALGGKDFLAVKKEIIQMMEETGIKTATVSPTIVYGGGRKDTLAKLVPVFKFLGLFSQKMKPVPVQTVAQDLVRGLVGA